MKPDISLATKSGHFYLLTTLPVGRLSNRNAKGSLKTGARVLFGDCLEFRYGA